MRQALSRLTDQVVRYDGEEFAVLLPDTTSKGGMEVAESIRQTITSLSMPAGNTSVSSDVSVSLRVTSVVPRRNQAATELLRQADKALYQAQ